jgi:hypothetical protein
MRYIDIGLTLCGLAILLLGANPAEALEPWPEFDAKSRRLRRRGRRRSTSARSLGASVLGGEIATTIDGQMTKRVSGDYWTVNSGSAMQVTVLGEFAVLETIVVAKQ